MELEEKKIEVVYEDADMMVVAKPAGVVTTRESAQGKVQSAQYLEDWVEEYAKKCQMTNVKCQMSLLPRKGIVHRLDKGTSGLVVVAKNADVLAKLKLMFKQREVKKTYLALVSGAFPFEAEVQMPIKRSNYGFEKFGVHEDGKTAWTMVKLVEKYSLAGKIYSLLSINLKTGRTHQIRVHLSYLRYPIVGDRLYGGEMILERPFLHAWRLSMKHPRTGAMLELQSNLPSELVKFLEGYEKVD